LAPIDIKLPPTPLFKHPPILVGAMAKYYYDVGSRSDTLDFVLHDSDFSILKSFCPTDVRWAGLDQVIQIDCFRFRRSIELFQYESVNENAVQRGSFAIISLDRLYFITVMDSSNSSRAVELDLLLKRMTLSSGAII
jgi:hypothetical protein